MKIGLIENNQPNPAMADLDGDGEKEIFFSSYDGGCTPFGWTDPNMATGRIPCTMLVKDYLPLSRPQPVVADLDNNGRAEVIFGSWVRKGTRGTGKLHIVDYLGNPMFEVDLPPAYGSPNWNGALAAPTLDRHRQRTRTWKSSEHVAFGVCRI